MLKTSKNKLIVILLLVILALLIVILFMIVRWNDYQGISCIACHRNASYLRDTEQDLSPYESQIILSGGETVEELALLLMNASPWMCESCANVHANEMLYPPPWMQEIINNHGDIN